MLTSRQILILLEDYVTSGVCYSIKRPGNTAELKFPIYVNPGSSDLRELEKSARLDNRILKELRFIADANHKKFYVCDAYLGLHEKMLSALSFYDSGGDIIGGTVKMSGGKPLYPDIFIKSVNSFNYDWTFVDKYIKNFSLEVENIKNEYNR